MENFKELAMRTKKPGMAENDVKLGLLGEAGEMIDAIKKIAFHGHTDLTSLKKEIGDLLWYITAYRENGLEKNHNNYMTDISADIMFNIISAIFNHTKKDKYIDNVMNSIETLCSMYNISLDEVQQMNIDKLMKRYPEKYTDYNSINRVE